MPGCHCRMIRGGLVMMSRSRIRPVGAKMKGMGLLLNPTDSDMVGIQPYDPINLTSGKGMKMRMGMGTEMVRSKSDVQTITDKLDKLTLMKPKNVKKNIRVAL